MHKLTQAFLVVFMLSIFAGCTTDDICSGETQTTPKLVLNFADNKISGISKPLTHVKIRHIEMDTLVWDAPADTIAIPLYTDADISTYSFSILKGEKEHTNTYEFRYSREEVYVNRACGFKMHFADLNAKEIPNKNTNLTWAKNITIINPIVEDEKRTHVTILH